MTDKSSAADRRLDMMIRLALLNIAEEKWKQIEELDVSDVTLSERHVKRMRKLLTKGAPAVRRKKIVKRVLLVALVALSTLAMLGMAIRPVRQAFSNAIVTWYKDFFRVEMQDLENNPPNTLREYKEPTILSQWSRSVQTESQFSRSIKYSNESGESVLYIQEVIQEPRIQVDDDRQIIETRINGLPAMLYTNSENNKKIIQWEDESYHYIIESNVKLDKILEIAESIG